MEWLSDSVKHEFFQHAPVFSDEGLRDFDIFHNISILGGFELCVSHLFDHQELIVSANDKAIHTLDALQAICDKDKSGAILLRCRNGRIGYFNIE